MDSYLDIRVLPDPEFAEDTLMAALVAKLHRALGARGKGDIGISFPDHGIKPGGRLRIHGSAQALRELESGDWRKGLKDYCASAEIAAVPAGTRWRTVSRAQVKSSPQRLLRRSVRKGWISQAEADRRQAVTPARTLNLPYLNLKSLSSQQHFRLFIAHGELRPTPTAGAFSSYGLSATATVPWF
ncbi:type I-F CRISPR-associated endoribonuclease Cas6/Csy4 [Pluralibacter gergoviae]|uniref:type I-F CRISPR-associated endoribonuclease Cas6/Csy4 n=1 Tax=Pluralibacter gergoviae TaxID=61647 RepID=UPI002909F180|nr:type I-F CRISPR-associated endoribonuclease Cas6/Csy4 [Pluralibacter gergoviae]MDU4002791.1 type I-F CRISPR-associated endoribonuclease Cas6/Csy4 [Pluralibacter gergoviae]